MNWNTLSRRILDGGILERGEALALLASSDDDLLSVLDAAFAVRRRYFGRRVSLHVIRNAKSGSCSENCSFCSQSAQSETGIPKYPLISRDELIEGAKRASEMSAKRYCIVTSGRNPSEKDLDVVCEAVEEIKKSIPIQVCTSLGLLTPEKARRLKAAGVDRYNHNLESSENFFPRFCTSHAHADRVTTVRIARSEGMEICSGGLVGMGETLEDRVDLAFSLRDLHADSIPVNFLNPRPGTPLEGLPQLTPADCLRTLAMFRLAHPTREIRVAGGREACIGKLQVLALYAADSMFTTGYLTTPGQGFESDMEMIAQAGFEVTEYLE